MHVTHQIYEPVEGTVVADLSWLLYRNHFAMPGLGVILSDGQNVPTGHIHGTLSDLLTLAALAPRVILAVDSDSDRKLTYPDYKGNRNKSDMFPIKTHLPLIIAAATMIPNVYFMKRDGFEADDLINSIIFYGDNPTIFGSDNDLMMQPKPFKITKNIAAGQIIYEDMELYLKTKYDLEGMSNLPIWWKVIRGDHSDNIHPGCPRYLTKDLLRICQDLKDTMKWEDFAAYVEETKDLKLKDHEEELFQNWELTRPRLIMLDDEPIHLKKLDDPTVGMQLFNFQCMSVIRQFSTLHNINFF